MTASELLQFEITQVGNQIEACVKGLSEAGFDTPCSPGGMTPRDILEHLCEAYVALLAYTKGEKHEWGSYAIADKSTDSVLATYRECRKNAVDAIMAKDDETSVKHAYDFIVGHDNYHVGQLVLSRRQAEPDWNSYAIYGE